MLENLKPRRSKVINAPFPLDLYLSIRIKLDKMIHSVNNQNRRPRKLVLSIAGSDPSGGAGIQGDIKTIEANGVFALSVITAVTAQNSLELAARFDLPLWIIEAQLKSLTEDFDISAVKTGMLSSKEIVSCVATFLAEETIGHLVVDPVMVSKDGSALLNPDAITALKTELIPLSSLLTPNISEAEHLTGEKIKTISEAEEAAYSISKLGCQAVLVKGGHLPEAPGCDILFDGDTITHFKGDFIETAHTHGTGCTYSSAISAQLAKGKSLHKAVMDAKNYVTEAIRHGLSIGHGHGPTNHFYFLD